MSTEGGKRCLRAFGIIDSLRFTDFLMDSIHTASQFVAFRTILIVDRGPVADEVEPDFRRSWWEIRLNLVAEWKTVGRPTDNRSFVNGLRNRLLPLPRSMPCSYTPFNKLHTLILPYFARTGGTLLRPIK